MGYTITGEVGSLDGHIVRTDGHVDPRRRTSQLRGLEPPAPVWSVQREEPLLGPPRFSELCRPPRRRTARPDG